MSDKIFLTQNLTCKLFLMDSEPQYDVIAQILSAKVHVRDVKGRHDLRRWTKLGTHAQSNTSVCKTTTVFFLSK